MAGKPQTEGIIDNGVQTPSPLRAAPQPDATKTTIQHEGIIIDNEPQLVDHIQEKNPHSLNTKMPPIVREQDPQMVTPLHMLGEQPTWIDCPACRQRTLTKITKEASSMQTIAGLVLCLFCVCLACLPCINHWCENINIYCSSCNARVATIPHDGQIQVMPVISSGQQPSAYRPMTSEPQ
ncbi:hypothetical protein F4779DRAFT_534743 [Xylariaceae sp. FL0662B]|nr:hypothetical protein F4779DRAFT_534743 [Xylariaceae sp. FL0662B]